jgi:hypothetical protein
MTLDDYASAVDVPGLDSARVRLLVEHILSRNQALVDRPPVPLAVARCAAALMAADEKLPSPMALAQAEALAQTPEIGPALMTIQENLMALTQQVSGDSPEAGIPQQAAVRVLRHLIAEGTRLMACFNQQDAH